MVARLAIIAAIIMGVLSMSAASHALPNPGDWVTYKVINASEWIPTKIDTVILTVGAPARLDGIDLVWWQMVTKKKDGTQFTVQALSEQVPMSAEDGDIGRVYRYIFKQDGRPALEYVDKATGRALLPLFGFRTGLVPTPRSRMNRVGGLLGTGNYLGQALAAQQSGHDGEWVDLENSVKKLVMDNDLLIGNDRMFKDDGTGKREEDGEYTYIEYTPEDYDEMIETGFNIFPVNDKHAEYVRERAVFFTKRQFGNDPYPEILYRSNYWGPANFADEPAIRLDSSECRTVYDAANLLRLRNFSYFRTPEDYKLDWRKNHNNGIMSLINETGESIGDWIVMQDHVPVWETIYESSFYQMEGGAAGLVHEGRYNLDGFNAMLKNILGPGAEADLHQMFDLTYGFIRGAARCFDRDWGTAIYGQADYSIAPDALKQAYDMGARYLWYWTSDHDHHLPYVQQLELTRIMRQYQKEHPRNRQELRRQAKVAVAMPDGYIATGWVMWNNPRFRADKLNEFGVRYGDINARAYYEMYRLAKQGVDFDVLIDVPHIIDRAGYQQIIRVGYDAQTNLPAPTMPVLAPEVRVTKSSELERYQPKPEAPVTTAKYVKRSDITLDGDLKEWKNAQWISLDTKLIYEVVNDKWGGEQDLSAQAAFAYDDEAVYVAVKVRDDVLHGQEEGDLIWQNDSIQVAFDPFFNPHPEGFYALDDSEIGFGLVNGKPYAHRWDAQISGAPGEVPGAEVAIVRKGDVTCYEARVPFSALAPLTPSFPGLCGMSVCVNDADGGLRRGAVAWTNGLADGKNPSKFGVLRFEGSEKLIKVPPVAFAQAEKTVVRLGEDVVLRLDAGTRMPSKADLSVLVRSGDVKAQPSAVSFSIPKGMNRFDVKLSTTGLEPGSYRADLVVKNGDVTAIEQSVPFFVVP